MAAIRFGLAKTRIEKGVRRAARAVEQAFPRGGRLSVRNLLVGAAMSGVAMAFGASPVSASILPGDLLQINYLFPNTGTVYQTNTALFTGPGTTLPIIYTGSAIFDFNHVLLTQNFGCCYSPGAFNGVEISDLSNPGAFAGWVVLPGATFVGFNEFQSAGSIFVNWAGSVATGDITIGASATPLPAALPLFAGGLGAMALLTRRKKRKASAILPA